jgi:hypothetical protein
MYVIVLSTNSLLIYLGVVTPPLAKIRQIFSYLIIVLYVVRSVFRKIVGLEVLEFGNRVELP